jgi:hypothetical protein
VKLAEQDNFPALFIDRRFQGNEGLVAGQFAFQPLPSQRPTNKKGNGGADNVSKQCDREPPPKTKKEAGADAQHPARQQQHVTTRVEKRITNRAPGTPPHNVLLYIGENIDERKDSAQDEQRDPNHKQRADLQNDCASHLHHLLILAGAAAVRNSAANCGSFPLRWTDCENSRQKTRTALWFGKRDYR